MEKVLEEAELCGALNLAGRKMKDFPSEMSTKYDLSDLVSLDLSGNRLSDVPTCVCESRSLESLRLRGNVLRSVPLNILFLRSLTVLDLSNNKIVQLPLSLFELPLEIMLLTGNRLSSIPREIRQLSTTLVEFDVSCNFLTSIPADIALLKMLRVLNLRRNLIESFPTELCHLSLHTLDLSYNRIRRLPLHIGRMESLVELHIGSNPLQSPPASLIVKGREHIVKWMDIEASTGVHQDLSEYCDDSRSDFVFQNSARDRHNIGTNLPSNAVMRSQHSLSANIAGSDSGYASTTDDQRLHHEYGTSTYHSKVAACSGGVNKEFTDVSSVAAVPSTKSDRVLINGVHKDEAANAGNDGGVKFVERGWTSLLKAPNSSAVTLQNGNAEDHCKTEELVTTTGKPISKVGPLVPPRTQPSSTISTQLQEAKALKEEVSTTVPGSVAKKWRSSTSPRLQKPAVSTNLPSTKTSNPPSSGSNQRSRLPSHVGRISNTVAAVPKSTLLDDQQRQKSVPRSTTVKNNKITALTVPKAKRNVDSFVASCRKLGVSESMP
ncbi:leucine Rich repeat-containing domain protein [Ancylostoma ceylanicum]|uniref:Leucine Rich repeat-containing domain protein n=1 Tax=Ancylostoma ceylanicum TaxID=53326 RepID=A0A0D6LU83_9BILA|nr:leucine Rich repeat-containing domain protein [Ancylostoma ceylanicum]